MSKIKEQYILTYLLHAYDDEHVIKRKICILDFSAQYKVHEGGGKRFIFSCADEYKLKWIS